MNIFKKSIILSVLFSLLLFYSCKKNDNKTTSSGENIIQSPQNIVAPTTEQLINNGKEITNFNIDLDLTKMSATMIYSTVFDMLIMADEYIGKNVKVKGNFEVFVNETTGERYFTILIPDATACCQQGIEFIWLGDHVYPDDYPVSGEEVTISGNYNVFENENGITYTYLKAFSMDK